MYVPQAQMTEGLTALANNVLPLSWAVRTAADPMSIRVAIERELHAVDGQLPVSRRAHDGAGAVGGRRAAELQYGALEHLRRARRWCWPRSGFTA